MRFSIGLKFLVFVFILSLVPCVAFGDPEIMSELTDQELQAQGLMTDQELDGTVSQSEELVVVDDDTGHVLGVQSPVVPKSFMVVSQTSSFYPPVDNVGKLFNYNLYRGASYIYARDSVLDYVTIWLPIDVPQCFGVSYVLSNRAILRYFGTEQVTGIMLTRDLTQYTIRFTSMGFPQYRLSDSSLHDTWHTLDASVLYSNVSVATQPQPISDSSSFYNLVTIGLMGVIILCLMRSKRW